MFLSVFQLIPDGAVPRARSRRRLAGLRTLPRLPDVRVGVVRPVYGRVRRPIRPTAHADDASLGLAGFTAVYASFTDYPVLLALVLLHGIVWSSLLVASAAYLTGSPAASAPRRRHRVLGAGERARGRVAPSVGFWLYSHGWIWLCAGHDGS